MDIKRWVVKVISPAKRAMREIKDRRIQEILVVVLQRLEYAPDQQGKKLNEELIEYRSVRAVSQRYRIIYHISDDLGVVFIANMGIRKEGDKKDVYVQTKKLLRQGTINLNIEIENVVNERKKSSEDTKPETTANGPIST
jgi:mRNA interferase RelE/StbE